MLTCWPVVAEAAWLLRKRPDALHRLFESFEGGLFALLVLDAADLPAIAATMRRYESAGIQLADATIAHLAEREHIRTVFTTDRRDFSIIRLKRNQTLTLIPELQ
jgi:predicted nucleic acid-binding protein